MKTGSWVIVTVLLGILAATFWFGYQGWTSNQDVQVPGNGYIAMALGIFFSLAIGIGLMALIFYSSRAGYDEPPHLMGRPRDPRQE